MMRDVVRARLRARVAKLAAPFYLAPCNEIGRRVRVFGRPGIQSAGVIRLGDDVTLRSSERPVRLETAPGAEIVLGAGCTIEAGASISAWSSVRLGERVHVGADVVITDEERGACGRPIAIGDGVVLGARARVLAGASVAAGSIVAPGAVVGSWPVTAEGTLASELACGGLSAPAGGGGPDSPSGSGPAAREGVAPSDGRDAQAGAAAPEPGPGRAHLASVRSCRGVLIADSTVAELATELGRPAHDGLAITVDVAPFGQVVQTLDQLAAANGDRPDFALVWTRAEQAIHGFRDRLEGRAAPLPAILEEVDGFAHVIEARAAAARFVFVASWVVPPHRRGLGLLDLGERGLAAAVMSMNVRLAQALARVPNVFVLDAQRWVEEGRSSFNPKLWYMAKIAHSTATFAAAARELRAALNAVLGRSRKLLVVDLDETLWGGVVGEVGWEALALGGHDARGEAFVDFQRALLALSRRGVALAVVSKNDEAVALEAMRRHPEMLIRPEALAGWRINWRDKADNVVSLARELNLGLQSVVFVDDHPLERARVRSALPEVMVPEWPADPAQYVRALDDLTCFDTAQVTDEDQARTKLYQSERARAELKVEAGSVEEWLSTLGTEVTFAPLDASNAPRTTQLLNKTNQMNLRTRRLGEGELVAWAREPGHELWAVTVADRFGSAGLTGILGLRVEADHLLVEDFVLSCRVMGRRVEETLAWAAVERARALGLSGVVAEILPTAKNRPCLEFWERSGFARSDGGTTFTWDTAQGMPRPASITVRGLTGTPAAERLHA